MWIVEYNEKYEEDDVHVLGIFSTWDTAAKVASTLDLDRYTIKEATIDPFVALIEGGYYPFVVECVKGKNPQYTMVKRTPDNMTSKARYEFLNPTKGEKVLRIYCIAKDRGAAAVIVAGIMEEIKWS